MFTQMGSPARRGLYLEESYCLVVGFPTDATDLAPGNLVQLLTTGKVARISAASQRPLGYVVSSWQKNDDGNVRVSTPFVACADNQNAAAEYTAGIELAATGSVDINGVQVTAYTQATSGQVVSAISLTPSTGANTPIAVGILRAPYIKPA